MFGQEGFELFHQALPQDQALRAEVDVGRRVLGNIEEPGLNAEGGVLQAEVQRRYPRGGHPQAGAPFATVTASHRASQDLPTLGEQAVHHKIQRPERLAH